MLLALRSFRYRQVKESWAFEPEPSSNAAERFSNTTNNLGRDVVAFRRLRGFCTRLVKMRRRYKLAAVVLGLGLVIAGIGVYQLSPWLPRIVFSSDLVLSGSDAARYDGVILELHGNIIVRDNAQLLVSRSRIVFKQSYDQQFALEVRGRGTLYVSDTAVDTSGKWHNWNYYDNSNVSLQRVSGSIWQVVQGNASLGLDNAPSGATLLPSGKAHVRITDADSVHLELAFTSGTSVEIALPAGRVDYWVSSFSPAAASYQVEVVNSVFETWAVDVSPMQNITVRDTASLGIGWVLGSGTGGPITLTGLRSGYYSDTAFWADGSSIRLINTTVKRWWPTAFSNANVTIYDSYLADIRFYANSTATIYNSQMTLVASYGYAHVSVHGSTIEYSLTARDDSVIEMFQTVFHGQVLALDRAQIYADGNRLSNGSY